MKKGGLPDPAETTSAGPDTPPPILRSWRALYAFVAGVLGLEIVLFWLFMKAFE